MEKNRDSVRFPVELQPTSMLPTGVRCRIIVAYDQPTTFLQNGVLQPLQVGRLSGDLDLGIPGDDSGDHISARHPFYAELTGTYWAWKNLTGYEHIGLFSSTELLDLKGSASGNRHGRQSDRSARGIHRLALDEQSIAEACMESDLLTALPATAAKRSRESAYSQFVDRHSAEHLHLLCETLRNHDPAEARRFVEGLSREDRPLTNTIVMRTELFREYCDWMFGLLAEVEGHVNPYEIRFQKYCRNAGLFGWFGRMLTAHFVDLARRRGMIVRGSPLVRVGSPIAGRRVSAPGEHRRGSELAKIRFRCPVEAEEGPSGPLVSVVMPVYNGAEFIVSTVESVLCQTLRSIELIVIDDGSRDRSRQILQAMAHRDSRITVLSQTNLGPGRARQIGLEQAKGEFVHFMDADDRMDPPFLELLYGKGRHYKADIVISSSRFFDSLTGHVIADIPLPHTVLAKECTDVAETPDLMLLAGHLWDKLFRREFVTRFPFNREGGEDLYVFWRAIASAERVAVTKEIYFNYRVRPQSVQSNPSYALSVLHTVRLAADSLASHPRREIVQPYFPMLVRVLMAYMLNRNGRALEANPAYRRQFYEMMSAALEIAPDVPASLGPRYAFFGGDCERVDAIARLPFESWWMEVRSILFDADEARWTSPAAYSARSLMQLDVAIALSARQSDPSVLDALLEFRRGLDQTKQALDAQTRGANRLGRVLRAARRWKRSLRPLRQAVHAVKHMTRGLVYRLLGLFQFRH